MNSANIYSRKSSGKEAGNILFTSLLLMLAMNFMALALMQTAQREYQTADFKTIDSSILYLAESCNQDTINWLKTQNYAPTSLPYTINKSSIAHLYNAGDNENNKARLTGYAYNCSTSQITVKSVTGAQVGAGEDVSNPTGYGASGDLHPDYYYEITANSTGPKNSAKKIITTVAVEY